MPDVGVLNLQIHDNSDEAVGGLDKLTDALNRVKNAVSGGLKLSPIATGLAKIGKAVDENIHGSTIVKIGQIADELSKLKGLENINVRINTGTSVQSVRDAVEKTVQSVPGISEGFDDVENKVVEVKSTVSDLRDEMSKLNPDNLKLDTLGDSIGDSTREMQMYGEMAKKAFETVRDSGHLGGVISQVQDMGKTVNAIIPYHENLENTWENIAGRINEAKNANDGLKTSISEDEQYAREFEKILESMKEKAAAARAANEEVYKNFYKPPKSVAETTAISDNLREIDLLKAELRDAENLYNRLFNSAGENDTKTIKAGLAIQKIKDQIWEYNQAIKEAESSASLDPNKYLDMSSLDLRKEKYNAMQEAYIRNVEAGKLSEQQAIDQAIALNREKTKIESLEHAMDSAGNTAKSFRDRLNDLNNSVKNSKLGKLASQFARIAKYRFLRAVLKNITAGFSEGVQNVYEYSKAIGSSFAPAMDSAASAILQMKNSIGAAVAPLIQALIPLVQTLVGWFIEGVNYLNQFIALLRGQATWTRAVPATASAFGKQEKAAKKAGNAIKDLLADWDELNIIQSQTSGAGDGAGTGAAEDYLKMFEEAGRFDNGIKETVDFIKNNFDSIMSTVEGIGAGILLWKISNAFGKDLNFLQKLEVAAGLTLLISGVKLTTASGYDIGKNGLNRENLLGSIDGIFRTALGGGLVGLAYGGLTGAGIGLLVGTTIGLIALAVSMDKGEKDKLYGDVKLTVGEIQEEVDKLFKLDVNAELTNAKVDHESIESAKSAVTTALHEAEADYAVLKLKMTHDNSAKLMTSVSRVIDTTNTLLDQYEKKISIGFGFDTNFSDPKYAQTFSVDKLTGLEGYVTKLGNKIGEILEDGIVDSIEAPLLEDLMKKLNNVTTAIATGKASGRFTSELQRGNYSTDWANVDRESIQAYANRYTSMRNDLYDAGYLQALETRSALSALHAGMVQRNIDEPGTYTDAEIELALDNYNNYDMDKAIQKYVDEASAEGRQLFIANMMTAFSSAVSKAKGQMDYSLYGSLLTQNGDLKNWINSSVATNLGWDVGDFTGVMDAMGMNGLDLLTEEMRRRYIIQAFKKLGENNTTYNKLHSQLGISMEEINAVLNSKNGGAGYIAPLAGTPATPFVQPGKTDAENEASISRGVQNGMKDMQSDQRSLFNDVLRYLNEISRKEFSVNITPGASWGAHNAKSSEAYSNVVGDEP